MNYLKFALNFCGGNVLKPECRRIILQIKVDNMIVYRAEIAFIQCVLLFYYVKAIITGFDYTSIGVNYLNF